jgi:hypothetical protein
VLGLPLIEQLSAGLELQSVFDGFGYESRNGLTRGISCRAHASR